MDKPPEVSSGQLSVWDTVSIIIGIVVGTSIFYVPNLIFSNVSNPWMGLIVWGAGGALALVGALCYAELATTYPRAGGDYVYLSRAFGPWAGFLFAWAQLTLVLTASIGAMVSVFGSYAAPLAEQAGLPHFSPLWGWEVGEDVLYAGLATVVLTVLNLLGVTLGKWTQNFLTLVKVAGLLALVVAGFVWGDVRQLAATDRTVGGTTWTFGALALILVLYAYGGWNDAAFVAAEVREPRRNIPRALLLGTGAVTLLYLLVNAAYVAGLGFQGVRQTEHVPAALLARTPLAGYGELSIRLLIMLSALGAANGLIFAGARVYATLGADYRLFAWLGHWRPGRGTPIMALLLQAAITLALLAALGTPQGHAAINSLLSQVGIDAGDWQPRGAFDALVSHTAPVFWLFFLLTGLSLFRLRERDAGRPRPFSVPLYPLFPILFCDLCAYMLYESIAYVQQRCLLGFAVLACGGLVYALSRLVGINPPNSP
jgi:APA family basic amino acid/polyamine antiporter